MLHARLGYRRSTTTYSRYRKAEPAWETVLDVDALGAAEGVSWVWAGSTVLDETLTLAQAPNLNPNPNPNVNPSPKPNPNPNPTPKPKPKPDLQ